MISSVSILEVDRGRAEVRVAELALDHGERHTLAGELDGARVAQLVRGESAPHAGLGGEPPELDAHARTRPRPPARRPSMMQNSGPTGSSTRATSHGRSCAQPQASIPISRRRPALPWRTSSDPRRRLRSRSPSASASCTRSPPRQSTTINAQPEAVAIVAGPAHHRD
jgi:hypothetical protein